MSASLMLYVTMFGLFSTVTDGALIPASKSSLADTEENGQPVITTQTSANFAATTEEHGAATTSMLPTLMFSHADTTQNGQDVITSRTASSADTEENGQPAITTQTIANTTEVNVTDCFVGNGETYRGTQDKTANGGKCKQWPKFIDDYYTDMDFEEGHNFCRNPFGYPNPVCLVNAQKIVVNDCDIPRCIGDSGAATVLFKDQRAVLTVGIVSFLARLMF